MRRSKIELARQAGQASTFVWESKMQIRVFVLVAVIATAGACKTEPPESPKAPDPTLWAQEYEKTTKHRLLGRWTRSKEELLRQRDSIAKELHFAESQVEVDGTKSAYKCVFVLSSTGETNYLTWNGFAGNFSFDEQGNLHLRRGYDTAPDYEYVRVPGNDGT
jgi:hypothetical protein